jgi:hypothetical protein
MNLDVLRTGFRGKASRTLAGALSTALLFLPGDGLLLAQQATPAPAAAGAGEAATKLPPDQLDSLVAPIALFPDDLLAQVLAASTYPLEMVQLQQWMAKNPNLKDKALADAVAKQPWDPAVQSMAAFPDLVKRLTADIQWTTDLGNAFLDQQQDVMDACQRMRRKAEEKGALKSNSEMKVETKTVEQKEVIVIQSANPEVIYVPSYNPTVVYPPPVYPYPPIYYPPYYPGTALISFGVGMAVGAAFWGGSCCRCGWGGGGNNIYINNNNNFNRNTNISGNRVGNTNVSNRSGNNSWQHNAQHRGGTPYANKSTASKYGGTTRGDSLASRQQASARQQPSGSRGGSYGGASNRGGASPGASNRSAGGANSIGGRDLPSGGGNRGGFGGGSSGYSGRSAAASSSRGASSMGSRGGGSRGGGRGGRR